MCCDGVTVTALDISKRLLIGGAGPRAIVKLMRVCLQFAHAAE